MTARRPEHLLPQLPNPAPPRDRYGVFRGLPAEFHAAYYQWHVSGQYEGVREFATAADVAARPPVREQDDWYQKELEVIDRHYAKLADSRALEIGCGDGNLTWKVATRCRRVVACDIDPRAVELSRLRLRLLGLGDRVEFAISDGAGLKVAESERFDVVFFVQVLEHVPHWQQAEVFDRVFGLVAPGGCLFISTPNRWNVRDAHDTGRLFIHWLPRGVRVPLARSLGWGLPGQDPCWPYPPVLHDYVSFAWMLRRARRACPNVVVSKCSFFPNARIWHAARSSPDMPFRSRVWRRLGRFLGTWLPLNYYLGEKVIFAKPKPA
jgi:SAM-dependent methyltransferase